MVFTIGPSVCPSNAMGKFFPLEQSELFYSIFVSSLFCILLAGNGAGNLGIFYWGLLCFLRHVVVKDFWDTCKDSRGLERVFVFRVIGVFRVGGNALFLQRYRSNFLRFRLYNVPIRVFISFRTLRRGRIHVIGQSVILRALTI